MDTKLRDGMTDEEKAEYAVEVVKELHDSIMGYNGSSKLACNIQI